MPTLSTEDIRAAIATGDVCAVSIDTTVFDASGKDFRNAIMRRLDQVQARGVRVVITDVVAREMRSHLREAALGTQAKLRTALDKHNERWRRVPGAKERSDLLLDADVVAFGKAEFDAFVEQVSGELISTSDVPGVVDEVLGRYFGKNPPFADVAKRKSEFPDAFALLTLEDLAGRCSKLLMCVSADKGWEAFANESSHLVCVKKLDDALALFHDQDVADEVVEAWRRGEDEDWMEALENVFEDFDFCATGQAELYFDAEPVGSALQYITGEGIGDPKVIAVDKETVTFTVRVEACLGFTAAFQFYAVDKVDGHEIPLGTSEAYAERTLPSDLTITADRSIENGLRLRDVEVAKRCHDVYFGLLDPFPEENPTHEKY